jgi:hypothetical protein
MDAGLACALAFLQAGRVDQFLVALEPESQATQ